jgi:hypothetical protein
MKKLNCFSCGGNVTRRGPGEYACDFCGTVHHIEETDVRLDRAFQLDDATLDREVAVLRQQRDHLDQAIRKAESEIGGWGVAIIGAVVLGVLCLLFVILVNVVPDQHHSRPPSDLGEGLGGLLLAGLVYGGIGYGYILYNQAKKAKLISERQKLDELIISRTRMLDASHSNPPTASSPNTATLITIQGDPSSSPPAGPGPGAPC